MIKGGVMNILRIEENRVAILESDYTTQCDNIGYLKINLYYELNRKGYYTRI